MEATFTVTLTDELKSALDDIVRQENLSPDEVIGEAVKQYLFFKRYRAWRERMIPQAEAQGVYSDQDVFDRVS